MNDEERTLAKYVVAESGREASQQELFEMKALLKKVCESLASYGPDPTINIEVFGGKELVSWYDRNK